MPKKKWLVTVSRFLMSNALYSPVRLESGRKTVIRGQWKYLIKGQDVGGQDVIVVAKLSVTGKLVIITVYLP
jgi:hypothetical protein